MLFSIAVMDRLISRFYLNQSKNIPACEGISIMRDMVYIPILGISHLELRIVGIKRNVLRLKGLGRAKYLKGGLSWSGKIAQIVCVCK